MEKYNRNTSVLRITVLILIAITSSNEYESIQPSQVPFNVGDIIEGISYHGAQGKKEQWTREGEFLIDTSTVYGPSYNDQFQVSIAYDGLNYLVVWADDRGGSDFDIYGARINQYGVVIDQTGIAISSAAGEQLYPSVSFNGTYYMVVWENVYYGGIYGADIYGTRVDQFGYVLDTAGIAISTASGAQQCPSVASNGTDYLVVWQDDRGASHNIFGARVGQGGNVLDPEGIVISTAYMCQWHPSVTFDGTNYFVVWADDRYAGPRSITGARINQSGIVLDSNGINIGATRGHQEFPAVAFDNTNFLVVWQDNRNGPDYDIYGTRVDQSATVLDTEGIAISTATNDQLAPALCFGEANYVAVWQDRRSNWSDVYGARIDQDGVVLDTIGFSISIAADEQSTPRIVFGDPNYLVVWEDKRNSASSKSDIYGARVDQTGGIHDTAGIVISSAADRRLAPAVASSGTNYLAVWADIRNFALSEMDIYGARVDQSGVVLDPVGIAVSTTADSQWAPSVASDGTDYLVVWSDYHEMSFICGTRIDQSGTVLDPEGIAIATALGKQYSPSIVFSGTNYFVVWEDGRTPNHFDIYGTRVDQSGIVLDHNGIAITTASDDQLSPQVASDGSGYLVVWQDERDGQHNPDIYGARVNQYGIVLDPLGIAVSTALNDQSSPSVASDGTNYFVVWTDERAGEYDYDIYGTRVDQSGNILNPEGIAIAVGAGHQRSPTVIFDGTDFLVVWQEKRKGDSHCDIYGARINTSGEVIDTYIVCTQSGNQFTPVITHGMSDSAFIVYAGWAGEVGDKWYNTMRIWGTFYSFVGIEEERVYQTPYREFSLLIYPNPFRKKTDIRFQITDNIQEVDLKIHDISGRLVKTLTCPPPNAVCPTLITWDGRDNAGDKLPSGVYFLECNGGDYKEIKKLILLN